MEKMKQIKISEFNHTLLKTIAASEGRQIQHVVEDILSKAINQQSTYDTQRDRIIELMEKRKEVDNG